MTKNLAYVAMTRHREKANLYYSRKSFTPFNDGIYEALARLDQKASTLDYEGSHFYEQALQTLHKPILQKREQPDFQYQPSL